MSLEDWTLRDWLMLYPGLPVLFLREHEFRPREEDHGVRFRLSEVGFYLRYAIEHPTTKRRTLVDVDALVAKWKDVLVGLSTAHTREEWEAADYAMDDIFGPILRMPVAQLREFVPKLGEALKADPRVPFFVWQGLHGLSEVVLKTAKADTDMVELKVALAREIAEMAERSVRGDLGEALVNALKWRDEDQLKKVKAALEKGGEAQLTGRQSCLYLEVAGEKVML